MLCCWLFSLFFLFLFSFCSLFALFFVVSLFLFLFSPFFPFPLSPFFFSSLPSFVFSPTFFSSPFLPLLSAARLQSLWPPRASHGHRPSGAPARALPCTHPTRLAVTGIVNDCVRAPGAGGVFWIGGGQVDVKLGLNVEEFIKRYNPFVADVYK